MSVGGDEVFVHEEARAHASITPQLNGRPFGEPGNRPRARACTVDVGVVATLPREKRQQQEDDDPRRAPEDGGPG